MITSIRIEEGIEMAEVRTVKRNMESAILAPCMAVVQVTIGGVVTIIHIPYPADKSVITGIEFSVPSGLDIMRG